MVDISFSGIGSITIHSQMGDGAGGQTMRSTTITDFPPDDEPFSVDEVEVIGHQFTLNNELFRWRKPVAYIVRVSVYANSANDETLQRLLEATKHDTDETELVDWDLLDVRMDVMAHKSADGQRQQKETGASWVNYEFSDGNLLSGTPCIGVDAEGRKKANRYAFIFGSMKIV